MYLTLLFSIYKLEAESKYKIIDTAIIVIVN